MKKVVILIIVIIILFFSNCFILGSSVYNLSFLGYPQETNALFLNPALGCIVDNLSFDIGYSNLFKDFIKNNFYNTCLSFNFCFKKLNFGLGYNSLNLGDVYSENLIIFNFGYKLIKNKVFIASNLKYYIFDYFYDEYYIDDNLADEKIFLYNFDVGFIFNFFKNFYLSFSFLNLGNNELGKEIKYSLPKLYILAFGYKYNATILNLEYHLKKDFIDNKTFTNSIFKIGLKQEFFYNNKFSFNFITSLEKFDTNNNFILGFEFRLLDNRLGIKYYWWYPISSYLKDNFLGNNYITIDFKLSKPKLEEKKLILEKKEEYKKETEVLSKPLSIEISSYVPVEIREEKKEFIKEEVVVSSSNLSVPYKSKPKVLEKKKLVDYKKEERENYKFPLAHKVLKGESLISISKKYYNNEKGWEKIYQYNKDKIIKGAPIVGEILIIPEP